MRAVILPADLNKPPREVDHFDWMQLYQEHSNIEWGERVNTPELQALGVVMVVDENGHDRLLGVNYRAHIISNYRNLLVGDAVLFGETQSSDGVNFTSVPSNTLKLLQHWGMEQGAVNLMKFMETSLSQR